MALTTSIFLRNAAPLCVWMALFTLLPIPPLAGAHLLAAAGIRLPTIAPVIGGWALFILSLLGVTRSVLAPAYGLVAPLVLGSHFAG
jgi:hypothetical protein